MALTTRRFEALTTSALKSALLNVSGGGPVTPNLSPAGGERRTGPPDVLPDVLRPGLKIVFCGTAAGNVSARLGAYYAHPQNKFWQVLHGVGLTPRRVQPQEYPEVAQWGLGLTDIAKGVSGQDRELPHGALGLEACAALEAKIRANRPDILAFTSLTAGRRYLGRNTGFGESGARIGATRIWVLPSPSPAANWNWERHKPWWRMLAEGAKAD